MGRGVLVLRVYADRNYWTATGWKDHAVSNLDEGQRRGEGRRVDDTRRRGKSAGAAVAGAGEAL